MFEIVCERPWFVLNKHAVCIYLYNSIEYTSGGQLRVAANICTHSVFYSYYIECFIGTKQPDVQKQIQLSSGVHTVQNSWTIIDKFLNGVRDKTDLIAFYMFFLMAAYPIRCVFV